MTKLPPLAMAGLAKLGESCSILFWRGVIGVTLLLAVLGFFRRSKTLAWTALAVVAIAIAAVQPWTDFVAHSLPEDPDAVYWLSEWRELSEMLIGVSVPIILFAVGTIVCGVRKAGEIQPPAVSGAAGDSL